MRAVPGTAFRFRAGVALVGRFHPVAVVGGTRCAAIVRAARGFLVTDEIVAFQQVAAEVRHARQDAGIEHGDHDALALREVPRGRGVHTTGGVEEVPLVLRVVGVVGHQCRLRVGGTQVRTLQAHVGHRVLHRRIGIQFSQHLLHVGRAQLGLQADQVATGTELALHQRRQCRSTAGGAAADDGTRQCRLHDRELGRTIAGGRGAVAVLHDDAVHALLGSAGHARRFLGHARLCRMRRTDADSQRQHGGSQHIDAKGLLLGHVRNPLQGHG
ncbi:hypothetical protein D3C73_945490 [compost metagenome]